MTWPKIFFTSGVREGWLPNLKRRAEQHAATVVDHIDEATHVVVYDKEVSGGSSSSSSSSSRVGIVHLAYDDQLFIYLELPSEFP